jgi:DNA-binding MarR family transcriptional regulator
MLLWICCKGANGSTRLAKSLSTCSETYSILRTQKPSILEEWMLGSARPIWLARNPEIALSELATAVGVNKSSVSRWLKRSDFQAMVNRAAEVKSS